MAIPWSTMLQLRLGILDIKIIHGQDERLVLLYIAYMHDIYIHTLHTFFSTKPDNLLLFNLLRTHTPMGVSSFLSLTVMIC